MQTRVAEPKRTETSTAGGRSTQASQAATTEKKAPVRKPVELRWLIDRVLNDPDSVSKADHMDLIRGIGYQSALQLIGQSKARKQPEREDQLGELERKVRESDRARKAEEEQQEGKAGAAQQGQAQQAEIAAGAAAGPDSGQVQAEPSAGAAKTTAGAAQVQQPAPVQAAGGTTTAAELAPSAKASAGTSVAGVAPSAKELTGPARTAQPSPAQVTGKATTAAPAPIVAKRAAAQPEGRMMPVSAAKEPLQGSEAKPDQAAGGTLAPSAKAETKKAAHAEPSAEKPGSKDGKASAEAHEAAAEGNAAAEQPAAAAAPSGKEGKAPASAGAGSGKAQAPAAAAGGSAEGGAAEGKPKASAKPRAITIKAENPGGILEALGGMAPTDMFQAYSQAVTVSGGALKKQRQQTEAVLPAIQTPTGIPARAGKPGQNQAAASLPAKAHKGLERFAGAKQGGTAVSGALREFPSGGGGEPDPDEIMGQASSFAANPPGMSLTGEADPGQADSFQQEAVQHVQGARQAELEHTKQDFGENAIAPQPDRAVLKANQGIRAVVPPAFALKQPAGLSQEVADQVNPSLTATLSGYMADRKNEYAKGKEPFESGVTAAKQETSVQIAGLESEAAEKQRGEQEAAKAEVKGLRGQWQSEIHDASGQFNQEASAASAEKKRDITDIRKQKEGEVRSTLTQAEGDARKEYQSTKKEADKKQKDSEKESGKEKDKNIFQKAWDWTKEKAQQALDTLKKAVNFLFTQLRKAVKTIFDKAKALAVSIIEKGRQLIVKAIQGLGTVLKSLVNKVFARFPGIAKRITGLIDRAVNKAVQAVNKAAELLKKGVTAALNLMAKSLDTLFAGVQSLYNRILSGIGKFLNGDFREIFGKLVEGAQIAVEIAAAFATGGGSVLLQIIKWLATTLPQLLRQAGSVAGFVTTLRSMKVQDLKQLLNPSGMGSFLVKGLFGELKALPQAKEEDKDKEEASAEGGREEKGLLKVFSLLLGVFKTLQGAYGKVAGAINKVLPAMNISTKSWFNPFSMIYAGAVQALEVVKNPGEALSEGAGKLKEAAGGFFTGIKSKISETAGSIKGKLSLLGQPAQLMKLLANKAVDMVLNFIVTHPPSALIKAVFKGIEAAAGSSIVELVRKHIPFADKLFNKIAESAPVQSLMKPLEQPVKQVGNMIDQVTEGASGLIDNAEQQTSSMLGSGTKLLTNLAGVGAPAAGQEGKEKAGAGKQGAAKEGGGDFVGSIKGGIHTRLLSYGKRLLQSGKALVLSGVDKVKGAVTGLMVRFNIGRESHKLWVEKQNGRNVVMMASKEENLRKKIEDFEKLLANTTDKSEKGKISKNIDELKRELSRIESSEKASQDKTGLVKSSELVAKISLGLPQKSSESKQTEDFGVSQLTENSPGQIIFGELDSLGRPTGVTATITKAMIGTGSEPRKSIRPPGFLGGEPGGAGHARGHLLGNQLGGSGKDRRNLVTLYQTPVNSPIMRDHESAVRKAVDDGEIVRYSSIPIYDGDTLMPSGVTLRAKGIKGFSLDVTIINKK